MSLTGNEFAEKLVEQVLEQGADVESCEALEIKDGEVKTVVTDDGEYQGKTVIIATGAKHRMLGVDGEEKYVGEGISFCAVCDGAFYKDKTVAVVGGGNSALQEAILLSDLAKKVYVVQNLDFLTGEKKLADQLYKLDNVEVITGVTVESFAGESELEGIIIKNSAGESKELSIDGLFIAIGLIPQNEAFSNVVELDGRGYAVIDESCESATNGIFVAGDCRTKKIRQVTTAAADGAIAALAACDYIDSVE
ncbi:thioredoxin reductase [Ruminococcus sp. CAG:563]|nr:thioredoxin reductase [Ruminococcus sp. CAG:563]